MRCFSSRLDPDIRYLDYAWITEKFPHWNPVTLKALTVRERAFWRQYAEAKLERENA